LFVILTLASLAWSFFAAIAKNQGFIRRHGASRWVRLPVWLFAILIAIPTFNVAGESAALAVAPYSAAELEAIAEAAAAEEAALAAEQQRQEAEEAAKEEAESEAAEAEAARLAEIARLENLAVEVTGMTTEEASDFLGAQSVAFKTEQRCSNQAAGSVTRADVAANNDLILFIAVGPSELPDLVGMSENSAEKAVKDACYGVQWKRYFTTESAGTVLAQEPSAGVILEAGSEVALISSKKPSGVARVKDSVGSWSYLGPRDEEWEFSNPFELEGKLYIPIKAAFSTSMSWQDEYDKGTGYGTAIIVDEFNKEVPVIVHYGKRSVASGEVQYFTAEIPLTDLADQTPTKIFLYLAVDRNGTRDSVEAQFTMTW
jgi:hypothetical protein